MTVDEMIDWLNALSCQLGGMDVKLDGEKKRIREIACTVAMELDHMRSEIEDNLGN